MRIKNTLCSSWTFALLFFLSTTISWAGELQDSFSLGNDAYSRGAYATAVKYYRETKSQRGISASLLYNLANSYGNMGEIGDAVLAYEQALRFDHNNADIRNNLAALRKAHGLYSNNLSIWQQISDRLGINQWIGFSGILFFLCSCSLFLLAISTKRSTRRRTRYPAFLCAMAFVMTLPVTLYSFQSWDNGVVLTDTRLQISPFTAAASSGMIKEGQIIHPLKQHNGYIFVRDTTGRKGWMNRQDIGFIKELQQT